MVERSAASFRDPSGFVYISGGKILRQVNRSYQEDYDLLVKSGLYDQLIQRKLLIPHREVEDAPFKPEISYKVIQPEKIQVISYPYEWSFSQLKDAALLTLAAQKAALDAGMVLKDASAYNIQFHQGRPILIDSLSFAKYREGSPWIAYRQFCQHFLAPLALMSKTDLRLSKLLINHIDGIPLDLCSRLLPRSSRLQPGLATHIHLQAWAERRFAPAEPAKPGVRPVRQATVSKNGLIGLIENLEHTVESLSIKISGRDWANYYTETNYADNAFQAKRALVSELINSLNPKTVLDLGANTGIFSRELARNPERFVISADIDPEAVEINYLQAKRDRQENILPLVIDLVNPSPAIGWNNQERESFLTRGKADAILALALIHHLAISNNLPLSDIARTLADHGESVVLEFVPKEDSQVRRLLQSREDIFEHYSLTGLLEDFAPFFNLVSQNPLPDSQREILLFTRK